MCEVTGFYLRTRQRWFLLRLRFLRLRFPRVSAGQNILFCNSDIRSSTQTIFESIGVHRTGSFLFSCIPRTKRTFPLWFKNISQDRRGGIYWFWGMMSISPHRNPSACFIIFPAFFGIMDVEISTCPNPRRGIRW